METKFENNYLTIELIDTVDSTNAEDVGKEIQELREKNPDGGLIIDAKKLKYISSAGLRQMLHLKKKEKDFKIINVSSEVYEVFEMTGFTEMIDIQKAYREVSVEGCEKIGEGSNGIVYRLNPDTIIKVYKNNDALEDIKHERELAKTALLLGINTAIPFDVVKVGDKFGSVFELLSAKSLTKIMAEEPENVDKYIKVFVDLLKEIHTTEVKEGLLPDCKERVLKWVNDLNGMLPEDKYNKLLRMVNEIPKSLNMLHGDYHSRNVHYANGEAIIIDMDTLSVGNPIFEFANVFMAYQGFGELDKTNVTDFLKMDWELATYVWNQTIKLYFADKDEKFIEDLKHKAQVIGFTRLYRRTIRRESDNKVLLEHCRKRLLDEIDLVDNLII